MCASLWMLVPRMQSVTGSQRSIGPAEAAMSRVEMSMNAFGLAKSLRMAATSFGAWPMPSMMRIRSLSASLGARRRVFAVGFEIALERVELLAVDFFRLVPRGNRRQIVVAPQGTGQAAEVAVL